MTVSVDLHDTDGKQLAARAPAKARYETDVYRQREAGATRLIDRIIAVNDGDPDTKPAASKTHAANADAGRSDTGRSSPRS